MSVHHRHPYVDVFACYAFSLHLCCTCVYFLDQELTLLLLFFWEDHTLLKSLMLRRFKSDRDEIWQDCYSDKLCID